MTIICHSSCSLVPEIESTASKVSLLGILVNNPVPQAKQREVWKVIWV